MNTGIPAYQHDILPMVQVIKQADVKNMYNIHKVSNKSDEMTYKVNLKYSISFIVLLNLLH